MNPTSSTVSLSAIERYSSILEKITLPANQIVQLAALAQRYQAAFIALISNRGIKIVSSYGLQTDPTKLEHFLIPDWLIPNQARFFTDPYLLKQIAKFMKTPAYKNAYGVAITTPEGIIGALWILGAPAEPLHTQAVQRELMQGFADQISHHLSLQVSQKPTQISATQPSFSQADLVISLAQIVQEGFILSDQNGVIEFVNAYLENLLQTTTSQLMGHSLTDFVAPANRTQIVQMLFALAKGQAVTPHRWHRAFGTLPSTTSP
jgi:PAS domain-containing protein